MVRNPRSRVSPVEDDSIQTINNDLAWAVGLTFLLMLLIVVLMVAPRVPPIEPEDSALYITSEWDTGLPRRSGEQLSRYDISRAERLSSGQGMLYNQRIDVSNGVPMGYSTADFDLWAGFVDDTGRCEVVGYPTSMRKSTLLKLDEDDRGWNMTDVKDDVNREVVGARTMQLIPGLYRVAVHLFSARSEQPNEDRPLMVRLKIEINRGREEGYQLMEFEIPYTRSGQEYGVLFRIDENGHLVDGSVVEPNKDIRIATVGRQAGVCGTAAPAAPSAGTSFAPPAPSGRQF